MRPGVGRAQVTHDPLSPARIQETHWEILTGRVKPSDLIFRTISTVSLSKQVHAK